MTDLYRTMLANDGEGITHGDANDAQAFLLARIADQLYEHLAGGPLATAAKDPDLFGENADDLGLTSLIYTMTGGEAMLWTDGTPGNELRVKPGTIFQKIGASDGLTAHFLPYTIQAADVALTVGNGDATNPRIDIVQVKLELVDGGSASRDFKDAITGALTTTTPNKTRRVQATISLKAGTPAATPAYPAPDAGYALLGAVRVPATWTAAAGIATSSIFLAGTEATIRQCSVPLRVRAVPMSAPAFDFGRAGNWTVDPNVGVSLGMAKAIGGAGTDLIVWAPGGHGERIVGVAVQGLWQTTSHIDLQGRQHVAILGEQPYDTVDVTSLLSVTGGTLQSKYAHLGLIADASGDSNPSAAGGPIGDPFWCRGGKSGPAQRMHEQNPPGSGAQGFDRTCLRIDGGTGSFIIGVTWYIAG